MKIAYITAGAAGMYCGSCLHDNTLAAALLRKGYDVSLIPTYTPIRTDEQDVSIDRVFYGAANVYLEQKSALFRGAPGAINRLLDSQGLLRWISSHGPSSTDARELGEITLSVLLGEDGNQKTELDKLVTWLRDDLRPDLVHLTNSMFLGVGRSIRRELGVPVLCSVQGEDLFLDDLVEPFHSSVKQALVERARDVDGFVATSRYYVDFMRDYLEVAAERMHRVRLGLNLEDHGVEPPLADGRPFVVGFLARRAPEKGLHVLAEAFRELAQRAGKEQVRLRVAGYLSPKDRAYVEGVQAKLESWGLSDVVEMVGEVDRAGKLEFLRSVHVLCVPTTYHEPKGLFVLEALANGVPVVQPRHGSFPELIEATGGGLLVEPGSIPALVDALESLMREPERRAELGRRGKEVVHREYTDEAMADETLRLYESYLSQESQGGRETVA